MATELDNGIVLVGTGRMAFHLGHAIARAGWRLAGIAGRDAGRTKELALQLRSTPYGIDEPWPDAALYILAVKDDAVPGLAQRIARGDRVLVHTSGALGKEALGSHAHRGVLWPIKSLSPGEPADLSATPLVIDASDDLARTTLFDLARSISGKVVELPTAQRRKLHLAAVFASNFPVYLMERAERLLADEGIDPKLLLPLWNAAARKVGEQGAAASLTGPARRGDTGTVRAHLDLLAGDADLRRAYALLSRMILTDHHPDLAKGFSDTDGQPDL
ncbi:MAG TPA: DUF2520 domain-containing protein [Flavobacteriales bacterium]|nr:DUF2520 domain-containing protein [Flavobacteriales bacterium]